MNVWTRRFLGLAKEVSRWSKDDSTQVGSVIVDGNKRVISLGFNGPPQGVPDETGLDRETRLRRSLHAESNAILFAHRALTGCTLYVTHPPCAKCAAMIVQAGITKVVAPAPDEAFRARWADDIKETRFMFESAGVAFEEVE